MVEENRKVINRRKSKKNSRIGIIKKCESHGKIFGQNGIKV